LTDPQRSAAQHTAPTPSAMVFAPDLLLTVTVEGADGAAELHLHAGGQGYWVAQLMAELGVTVCLVAPIGGEVGEALQQMLDQSTIQLRTIGSSGSNGWYVHDRRSGERVEVAARASAPLSRHELDELYEAALVEGLDADVCVLAGPGLEPVAPPRLYERLAADLHESQRCVIGDLSGASQEAALRGGLTMLKVSEEELVQDGKLDETTLECVVTAADELQRAGAETVVVTRADKGVVAFAEGQVMVVAGPRLRVVEARGAGDSFTAGLAAAVGGGSSLVEGLRIGAAAGSLNVTRRGLGTGVREDIERLASHIDVRVIENRSGT
jgi:1-phosphofructokinase